MRVRPMLEGDVPFANGLREIAGWNQSVRDWRGYLSYDPDGCFVAEVDGKPAGTATTIHYGDRFGWIGMVLVHPDYRRLGIGTHLLNRAIERLKECGVRSIKLDATPMGRKVYAPIGFVDEYELSRYEAVVTAPDEAALQQVLPFTRADFAAVAQLDAEAFGAERAEVLRSLSARNPELCFSLPGDAGVDGFLIAREGANAVQVGPWIARNETAAVHLLRAFLRRVNGRRVFIDVVAPNAAATAMMQSYGFAVQRTLTRMFLGENAYPGVPALVFGISSPEKG